MQRVFHLVTGGVSAEWLRDATLVSAVPGGRKKNYSVKIDTCQLRMKSLLLTLYKSPYYKSVRRI